MGGEGNLARLREALDAELVARGYPPPLESANWYPSVEEFADVYERAGFTEVDARLIERPTPMPHGIGRMGDDFPPRLARPCRRARRGARRDRRGRRNECGHRQCRLCPSSLHHEEAQLDALPAAERRRPQRNAASHRRRLDRRTLPRRSRGGSPQRADRGPAEPCTGAFGRARASGAGTQEHGGGRGALLPRLRRLQASHPGERRPHHPARRVPDRLHALSAGNRAGHAAGSVRIPDPGRSAVRLRSRQRVDVRRLHGNVGSHRHGSPHHSAEQDDHLVGRASALRQRRDDDGEVHRRSAPHRPAAAHGRNRRRAADRFHRRRDQRRGRPVSRHPRPHH